MSAASPAKEAVLPPLAGSAEANGALADFIWFRTGGPAEWLVRPRDGNDLAQFLAALPREGPVLPGGVGPNLLVRAGGVAGCVLDRKGLGEGKGVVAVGDL